MEAKNNNNTKYIFIIGGVVSSIGKGVLASSLGSLLKSNNYKVFIQKFDPYLNVDPGTMNPQQHGEVFVTYDGAETDLDLGHYERFLDQELTADSNITAGKIFWDIISKERNGNYLGSTVQYIPNVINYIKDRIVESSTKNKYDFVITEIGGTVGDLELQVFLEAIRQFKLEKKNNVCNVLITWVPFLNAVGEYKTKPSQNAIKNLCSSGLNTDILVIRSDNIIKDYFLNKLTLYAGIKKENIFNMPDIKFKYKAPIYLHDIGLDKSICNFFNMNSNSNVNLWKNIVDKIDNIKQKITIGIVGKYVDLADAYMSIYESLNFAGWNNDSLIDIQYVDAEKISEINYYKYFKELDGIIVPGGFGKRAVNGKLLAAKYARENNIPYLGICLGFQIAVIEYARNVLGIKNATSSEFDSESNEKVIDIISGKFYSNNMGGTLRLGNYLCDISKNSLANKIYKKNSVLERHRHRYEFNNKYEKIFNDKKCKFSGVNKEFNLKEIFEINNHPFFIGVQFHPEFKSRPSKPHPLFNEFIKIILKIK